ncbi:YgiQ family radical SAM protein [Emergencia sp. 1XD21-10]|uniref:YgiQ family radical SAM protein n=1 Tax=Emergencia sp. 1XD21-10 TaxID=2304569 RepID=UPI0013799B09|nr:YgiQ family radical SAM protein [Emergencia sp. 1XD21-10]NCE97756.1 YgiQ family radical SAM protein [Emergencia sp. 1XD21-10]
MFLPVTKKEIEDRGWSQVDFVLVSGDAYVDHHSFGTAIIGRLLESHGYKVAILPQPDYKSAEDFRRFGRPRLGFLINGGVVDSMVNNYSVFKRKRKVDEYSPGGISGNRPDRAVIVYSNRAREAYKDVPVIIGGIEASLRRLGHYDYWSDKVRRSILLDAKADLLIYGMGERAVVAIAEALEAGIDVKDITWIEGTCYKAKSFEQDEDTAVLPSYEEITGSKEAYCRSFAMAYRNNDNINGKRLVEKYADSLYVIQNKPQPPLSRQELDDVYELPYENEIHPIYEAAGGIPAFSEIKFSLVSARGCFGGCSFCALTYHQGRQVRSRSKESLVAEARALTQKPDFKGYIHDVGGPTANFRYPACKKQLEYGVCKDKDCLYPRPCKNMEVDHKEYLAVLREIRQIPGVKKVFIRSGIRYDYVMADKDDAFLRELCKYHVSGTLKVAPEHITERVLYHMRKPAKEVFIAFADKYRRINQQLGLKQYLIPYLISSHPGSTLDDAVELALFLKEYGFVPDQVQDFYPTPATLATCMYYTEMDPFTMEPVYVAKDLEEKKMQRALIHYHKPENRGIVMKALKKAGREDLVGVLLGGRGRKYESDQRVHKDHGRGRKGVSKGRR